MKTLFVKSYFVGNDRDRHSFEYHVKVYYLVDDRESQHCVYSDILSMFYITEESIKQLFRNFSLIIEKIEVFDKNLDGFIIKK